MFIKPNNLRDKCVGVFWVCRAEFFHFKSVFNWKLGLHVKIILLSINLSTVLSFTRLLLRLYGIKTFSKMFIKVFHNLKVTSSFCRASSSNQKALHLPKQKTKKSRKSSHLRSWSHSFSRVIVSNLLGAMNQVLLVGYHCVTGHSKPIILMFSSAVLIEVILVWTCIKPRDLWGERICTFKGSVPNPAHKAVHWNALPLRHNNHCWQHTWPSEGKVVLFVISSRTAASGQHEA